jgi:MSHA pilin protein MshC
VAKGSLAKHGCWEFGYSLIELVSTLVIVAILGAVIAPKMFSYQPFQARGYVDELASALHYARDVAVSSRCDTSITINAAGYQAMQRAAAGATCAISGGWVTPIVRVDGGTLSGSAPSGVSASPVPTNIVFDANGRVISGTPPALLIGTFTLTVDTGSGLIRVN